jgi:hypothetical protein
LGILPKALKLSSWARPYFEAGAAGYARGVKRRFLGVLNRTLNRVTSRMARSGHGPFSLIRHVGRRSGRTYETPVILATVPEGFRILDRRDFRLLRVADQG